MTIKIGALQAEINADEVDKDFFDVETDELNFQIANTDGEYSVYNAVDGFGRNCYKEFKDAKVEVVP